MGDKSRVSENQEMLIKSLSTKPKVDFILGYCPRFLCHFSLI